MFVLMVFYFHSHFVTLLSDLLQTSREPDRNGIALNACAVTTTKKVEHDRIFKKHHHNRHVHHSKKIGESEKESTISVLPGVQTPEMFLISQGMTVNQESQDHLSDSDDYLSMDPLVPGDV